MTIRTFFKAALLLAAAALSACAWQEGVRPKQTLRDTDFAAIKVGASEAEVDSLLGKPILTTEFKRLDEMVWDYRYMYGVDTYVAEIHFDLQGQVKRLEYYPDRCPLRAIPCR
jgi:outer membrane protein assembly factor BamE (lipoprotein component of BamABCDE complex)